VGGFSITHGGRNIRLKIYPLSYCKHILFSTHCWIDSPDVLYRCEINIDNIKNLTPPNKLHIKWWPKIKEEIRIYVGVR